METSVEAPQRHRVTRVRREPRRRMITVTSTLRLTPSMLRLDFASEELGGFESASPDDHIKLFVTDASGETVMRDYTPRRFDVDAQTFTIDFAVHDAGPATAWALSAKPGDQLEIGGPRGSAIVEDDFDWYMLIGDETALPSIGRRLEELRPGVKVIVLAAVDGPLDEIAVTDRAGLQVEWSHRAGRRATDAARLIGILDRFGLPPGDGYVWIAAEAAEARALKSHVVEHLGHPQQWVKAAGYWVRGAAGTDEKID